MSNILDFKVDDIEEVSSELQYAIEELEEMKEAEEINIEDINSYVESPKVTLALTHHHKKNIKNIDKLIDFLEDIKDSIDEFIEEMENTVKPNANTVKIDAEKIGDAVKKIEEHIEDGNFYKEIVKEGNVFDVWEMRAKRDLVHLTKEDKKEQEEYDYCRKKLDDLNDELYKLYRKIEDDTYNLTTTYRLIFEDLKDGDWIKELVKDLEMEDFDFSEFSSIDFVDTAITITNKSSIDKFKNGINSIDEYNELLALYANGTGPKEIIEIFENHLITNEEALENLYVIIDSLSKTEDWNNLTDIEKTDWILTLLAGAWYYNDVKGKTFAWKSTINNDYFYVPDSVWDEYSSEIIELYHWIRDNANEQKHGDSLIDWSHYCATMASYIGDTTIIAKIGANIWSGGSVSEAAGWLGDYRKDGLECSARDITTDYMALKTIQIYQNGEISPLDAVKEAYDGLNGAQLKDWDEFESKVISEDIYTQLQFNRLIDE